MKKYIIAISIFSLFLLSCKSNPSDNNLPQNISLETSKIPTDQKNITETKNPDFSKENTNIIQEIEQEDIELKKQENIIDLNAIPENINNQKKQPELNVISIKADSENLPKSKIENFSNDVLEEKFSNSLETNFSSNNVEKNHSEDNIENDFSEDNVEDDFSEDNIEEKIAEDIYATWTNAYEQLLKKYVHLGTIKGTTLSLVDYDALSSDANLENLRNILAEMAPFSNKDASFRLCMWINAYNFLTIYKVAKNKHIKQFNDLAKNGKNVWKLPIGKVAGVEVTLDSIENEIIRKKFNEPRIHFALVCAAVGCPSLRDKPYRATTLNVILDEQLMSYTKSKKTGFNISQEKIYLSQIFSWFASDFGGNSKKWLLEKGIIPAYAKNYSVEYIEYDWTLNNQLFAK